MHVRIIVIKKRLGTTDRDLRSASGVAEVRENLMNTYRKCSVLLMTENDFGRESFFLEMQTGDIQANEKILADSATVNSKRLKKPHERKLCCKYNK